MKYAKVNDVHAGDVVNVDDGFTCMKQSQKTVREDERGLFVECDEGRHYLDGQLDEGDEYIGITK